MELGRVVQQAPREQATPEILSMCLSRRHVLLYAPGSGNWGQDNYLAVPGLAKVGIRPSLAMLSFDHVATRILIT